MKRRKKWSTEEREGEMTNEQWRKQKPFKKESGEGEITTP